MTDLFTAISNFGFPVVVAGYLLFRFENKIEKLTDAINRNTQTTDKLSSVVKSIKKQK